jgi:hypothetical protein
MGSFGLTEKRELVQLMQQEHSNSEHAGSWRIEWQMLWPIPMSVFLQFLGEHHDDAAGTADVREFVDVLVGRHPA